MSYRALQDKVAVITGASSGIGKAVALRYADEGAKVVLVSKTLEKCKQVEREILEKGQRAFSVQCNVTDEQQIFSLFDICESTFGKVDVVVANAGISGGNKSVADYELKDWKNVIETNLTGVFLTIREGFRRMSENGGHIIVMSSQAGVEGFAGKGAYCASKFGVRGLAHVLGQEGKKFNISVSTICPGTVQTPILAASNTKVENPMSTDAVADAALYLATLRGNSLVRDIVLERMHFG